MSPVIILAVLQKHDRLIKNGRKLDVVVLSVLETGIFQKFRNDRVEPVCLANDNIHEVFVVALQVEFSLKHLDGTAERCERVPDLMGDAGSQTPDGRQPLLSSLPGPPSPPAWLCPGR